jgi:hypothetical protein
LTNRASISDVRGPARDLQHARDHERPAAEIFDDLEALLALADQMMRAVRRGDVAHDIGEVPMRCMSIGSRIGDFGGALQQDADLALVAHRLLRGGDDFGRPSVIGSTTPGNSTVLRTGTMMSASAGSGGSVPRPAAQLRSMTAFPSQPRLTPAFCKVITRQPSTTARRTVL